MTDNEMLLALPDMLDKKLKPIKDIIKSIKRQIETSNLVTCQLIPAIKMALNSSKQLKLIVFSPTQDAMPGRSSGIFLCCRKPILWWFGPLQRHG